MFSVTLHRQLFPEKVGGSLQPLNNHQSQDRTASRKAVTRLLSPTYISWHVCAWKLLLFFNKNPRLMFFWGLKRLRHPPANNKQQPPPLPQRSINSSKRRAPWAGGRAHLRSSRRSHSVWCLTCNRLSCSVCVCFSSWVTRTWVAHIHTHTWWQDRYNCFKIQIRGNSRQLLSGHSPEHFSEPILLLLYIFAFCLFVCFFYIFCV